MGILLSSARYICTSTLAEQTLKPVDPNSIAAYINIYIPLELFLYLQGHENAIWISICRIFIRLSQLNNRYQGREVFVVLFSYNENLYDDTFVLNYLSNISKGCYEYERMNECAIAEATKYDIQLLLMLTWIQLSS